MIRGGYERVEAEGKSPADITFKLDYMSCMNGCMPKLGRWRSEITREVLGRR
jgi:hypothetical protein